MNIYLFDFLLTMGEKAKNEYIALKWKRIFILEYLKMCVLAIPTRLIGSIVSEVARSERNTNGRVSSLVRSASASRRKVGVGTYIAPAPFSHHGRSERRQIRQLRGEEWEDDSSASEGEADSVVSPQSRCAERDGRVCQRSAICGECRQKTNFDPGQALVLAAPAVWQAAGALQPG